MSERRCVVCKKTLKGNQRTFCSETCKQRAKYLQSKGRLCRFCKLEIEKPVPVLGGMKGECDKQECIDRRPVK